MQNHPHDRLYCIVEPVAGKSQPLPGLFAAVNCLRFHGLVVCPPLNEPSIEEVELTAIPLVAVTFDVNERLAASANVGISRL